MRWHAGQQPWLPQLRSLWADTLGSTRGEQGLEAEERATSGDDWGRTHLPLWMPGLQEAPKALARCGQRSPSVSAQDIWLLMLRWASRRWHLLAEAAGQLETFLERN